MVTPGIRSFELEGVAVAYPFTASPIEKPRVLYTNPEVNVMSVISKNTKKLLRHDRFDVKFDFMNWKKAWLILISGLVSLVTMLLLSPFIIGTAFDGICDNKFLSETPSPDRIYRVVVFQRSCGATTGFSIQVSVLKTGEMLPNQSGNLFVADSDRGKAPSGIGGGPEVRLSWTGLRSVRLLHHKNARVFLANPQFSEVSATYDLFN